MGKSWEKHCLGEKVALPSAHREFPGITHKDLGIYEPFSGIRAAPSLPPGTFWAPLGSGRYRHFAMPTWYMVLLQNGARPVHPYCVTFVGGILKPLRATPT